MESSDDPGGGRVQRGGHCSKAISEPETWPSSYQVLDTFRLDATLLGSVPSFRQTPRELGIFGIFSKWGSFQGLKYWIFFQKKKVRREITAESTLVFVFDPAGTEWFFLSRENSFLSRENTFLSGENSFLSEENSFPSRGNTFFPPVKIVFSPQRIKRLPWKKCYLGETRCKQG